MITANSDDTCTPPAQPPGRDCIGRRRNAETDAASWRES
jgi:hypothetical protein